MSEQYTHAVLRAVVGQLCQPLGWNALQSSACDVLVDILKNYLHTVAKTTAGYSIHANRTEPNLSDLALAFRDLGVNLSEVSEFCREVESNPYGHVVPKYPYPKKSSHVYNSTPSHAVVRASRNSSFSSGDDDDDDEDEGYIPSYLPPLPQKGEDGNDDDNESGIHVPSDDEAMDVATSSTVAVPDSNKGLPKIFRRALSSDRSEEGDPRSRRNSLSDVPYSLGAEDRETIPAPQAMSSLAFVAQRPTISTVRAASSSPSLSATPTTAPIAAVPFPAVSHPDPAPVAPPLMGVASVPFPAVSHSAPAPVAPPLMGVASVVTPTKERVTIGPSGDDDDGNGGDGDGDDDDEDDDDNDDDDDGDGDGDDKVKVQPNQRSSLGARSAIHPAPKVAPPTSRAPGKAPSSLDMGHRVPRVHDPPGDLAPMKRSQHPPYKVKPSADTAVTKPHPSPSTVSDQSPVHRNPVKGASITPPRNPLTSPYKAHPPLGDVSCIAHSKDSTPVLAEPTPVLAEVQTGTHMMARDSRGSPVGGSFDQPIAPVGTRVQDGFEDDLEVSSSEDSPPDSVVKPPPCPAYTEPGRAHLSRKRMKEEEEVEEEEEEEEEVEVEVDSDDEETCGAKVTGSHGAKVKLHGGQMHTEDWERGEVIKASPIRDEDGWPFALPKAVDGSISPAWEVLSSLEEEEELSVGEEPLPPISQVQTKAMPATESEPLSLVVKVSRKHLAKQKSTLQGGLGSGHLPSHQTTMRHLPSHQTTMGHLPSHQTTMGHLPSHQTTMGHLPSHQTTVGHRISSSASRAEEESVSLVVSINKRLLESRKNSSIVHQRSIGKQPLPPRDAVVKSDKKLSKPSSRKRELDISEMGLFGKEPKKIKVIPQPSSSGSSSDGESTRASHPSHERTAKRVELKVKLKLDMATMQTSSAALPSKSEKVRSLPKGSSHKIKSKKPKHHQQPAVIPVTVAPSSYRVPMPPPPLPAVPIGSDYICPQCGHHDDGTPMIGCDSCDEWLHWRCVGITQPPPEQMPWFCPSCQSKNLKKSKKKKKH